MRQTSQQTGITLIEMLIVLVILGILAILVIPSYTQYIRESRRAEALGILMNIQMAEEKYRANNTTYGNLNDVWAGVTTTPSGWYNLNITGNTGTAYTITAVGQNDQANDVEKGVSCTTLTLQVNGLAVSKTPTACWSN